MSKSETTSNLQDLQHGQSLSSENDHGCKKFDTACEHDVPESLKADEKVGDFEGCNNGRNSPDNSAVELSLELGSESDICEEAEQKGLQQRLDEELAREFKKSPSKNVEEDDESSAEEGQLSPLRDYEYQQSMCKESKDDGELSDDDIEEGEVKDSNPLPNHQPRRVCHFFNRGNCTWGNQCRFLHLSVNDRGFYNMFSLTSNSFVPYGLPGNRMVPRPASAPRLPPFRGSANRGKFRLALPPDKTAHSSEMWDRGLQSAKEAMKIAMERKEQELYYEEKKRSLSADENEEVTEHDKENFRNGNSPDREYDDLRIYDHEKRNNHHKKHKSGNSKSWTVQNRFRREYRADEWQNNQLEIEIRSRAYEWKDAWQRSKSPRRSRKRKLSSSSSTSRSSHSTHSSRSSYRSVHTSYSSSRSSSSNSSCSRREKISRRSMSNPRSAFRQSRSASERSTNSWSHSRSRSRSLSSLSLSSISSTNSSDYDAPSSRKEVQSSHKSNFKSQPVTRTLYEEMQRLRNQQMKERKADDSTRKSSRNTPTHSKKEHKMSEMKQPLSPESDKGNFKRMKCINSRRHKLLKQLKMLDDAISKRRAKPS